MATINRKEKIKKLHGRVRKKISGTTERPRLAVHKTSKHIYAQIIDDVQGKTLAFASSLEEDFQKEAKHGGNCAAAAIVGQLLAKKAEKNNIKKVVFDRGGHLYHGKIKNLADAAREAGLEF